MSDNGDLRVQPLDDLNEVLGDVADTLAREEFRMTPSLLHRWGIVRPVGDHGAVPRDLKHRPPRIPTAGEEPQSVNEPDRRPA